MSDLLLGALGLMLIFEGLLPLLNPGGWKQVFTRVIQMSDGQIRFFGLLSTLAGVLLLWVWR